MDSLISFWVIPCRMRMLKVTMCSMSDVTPGTEFSGIHHLRNASTRGSQDGKVFGERQHDLPFAGFGYMGIQAAHDATLPAPGP